MRRSAISISLAIAALAAGSVEAAEITVSYEGVVVRSSGPHEAEFSPGQAIAIEYTVDDAFVDSEPNPEEGVFHGGLKALRIAIPDAGVDATVGAGSVQTFNRDMTDQVFFYGEANGGQLAGLPITRAEVDFVEFVPEGGEPSAMLQSDAIPTQPLVALDSFAMLYTAEGYTFIYFLAEAATQSPEDIANEGRDLLADLADTGRLRSGHANALDSKLAAVLASIVAGNADQACGPLRAFANQVNALERSRQLTAETAEELRSIAEALGEAIGC